MSEGNELDRQLAAATNAIDNLNGFGVDIFEEQLRAAATAIDLAWVEIDKLLAEVARLCAALEAFPEWGSLDSDFSPGNEDWFRFFAELRTWDREQRQAALAETMDDSKRRKHE